MRIVLLLRILNLLVSLIALRAVINLEDVNQTRYLLQATVFAGMMSVLELGLGDYLVRAASEGNERRVSSSALKGVTLIALPFLLGFNIYLLSFYALDSINFILANTILLSGISSIYLSILIKLCYVKKRHLNRLAIFSLIGASILALVGLTYVFGYGRTHPLQILLLIYLYQIIVGVLSYFSLAQDDLFESNTVPKQVGERSYQTYLALEGLVNPIAIGLLAFIMTLSSDPTELVENALIVRVSAVICMFGAVEIMRLWQAPDARSEMRALWRYFLYVSSLTTVAALSTPFWLPFLAPKIQNLTLGFYILLALYILNKTVLDAVSQVRKKASDPKGALSIAAFNLVAIGVTFGISIATKPGRIAILFYLTSMTLVGFWALSASRIVSK